MNLRKAKFLHDCQFSVYWHVSYYDILCIHFQIKLYNFNCTDYFAINLDGYIFMHSNVCISFYLVKKSNQ